MLANISIPHETVKFCGKCDMLQRAQAWEIDGLASGAFSTIYWLCDLIWMS